MKTKFSLVLLALFICVLQLNGQNFNTEYKKLDSLPNISRLVHNVAIAPKWIDSLNFTYEIREKEDLKKYRVNVLTKSKELISEEKKNEVRETPPARG